MLWHVHLGLQISRGQLEQEGVDFTLQNSNICYTHTQAMQAPFHMYLPQNKAQSLFKNKLLKCKYICWTCEYSFILVIKKIG